MINKSIFSAADPCADLVRRIEKLSPVKGPFLSMEHFFSQEVQNEVTAIVKNYNNLSSAQQRKLESTVLDLLHLETESAVKVYQLPRVAQEVYDLGEKTRAVYEDQMWARPIP